MPYTWSPHVMRVPHSTAAGSPNRVSHEQAFQETQAEGVSLLVTRSWKSCGVPSTSFTGQKASDRASPDSRRGPAQYSEHEHWGGMLHWRHLWRLVSKRHISIYDDLGMIFQP